MYAFNNTIFPTNQVIPEAHIKLLDEFFRSVDAIVNDSPSASENFRNVFIPDGIWKTPTMKFEGHEELVKSSELWPQFKLLRSFQHSVLEVYGNDTEGKRLMLLGRIVLETKEGKHEDFHFSARVEVDTTSQAEARLKFFQGWSSRV